MAKIKKSAKKKAPVRGGAREGSGRPAGAEGSVLLNLRIPISVRDKIKSKAFLEAYPEGVNKKIIAFFAGFIVNLYSPVVLQ